MSYSFNVRAATKVGAISAVAAKLAEVVQSQPSHEVDHQQALAAAEAFVRVLPDPDETKEVAVSLSGSVGWRGTWGQDHEVSSAGVSVYANLVLKDTP